MHGYVHGSVAYVIIAACIHVHVNADSSSDNDAKKPMSPGPPPPPLRGIPHIKGPATPSSRPSTPLTPATHAPNLSELISALRAGQEINLSNISPPQAGPSSGVVREKLRNSTLAKTPRPKNTNSACTSSNESLSSSEKTKNVRKKLKKKSFHLSPRKPALARSFESELTKLPGKMVEKLPATAVAPSGQHPQRNDVLSPSVHHLVSSSTSTISSDSDGDMETRDKFDPGLFIVFPMLDTTTSSLCVILCFFWFICLCEQIFSPRRGFACSHSVSRLLY